MKPRRQPTWRPVPYDAVTECQAQTLLTEALALSEDDRAGLAAELLARLDEPSSATQAEIDRSWAAEIERRSARFRSGETAGVPWDQVRSKVERRLAAG